MHCAISSTICWRLLLRRGEAPVSNQALAPAALAPTAFRCYPASATGGANLEGMFLRGMSLAQP